MPNDIRTCESCGQTFAVSEKEQEEEKVPSPGHHFPSDCPEGLDTLCPFCDPGITECKKCRPKQDQQRS